MIPTLLCAMLSAPVSPPPTGPGPATAGELARALPFVAVAVGEQMWTAYRGPEHRGHYRVVASAYSRAPNGLELVVYWDARNPPEDAKRPLAVANPKVRTGPDAQPVTGSTEPSTPGTLPPGQVSTLQRSRYMLPAQTPPDSLWWDVGEDAVEVVRVHLRPHLSTPKKALLPPSAPWHAQRADAHSEALPKLSLLKATEDGLGCDWFVQDAPKKPPRRLGTGKQGCNVTYVALRPDGKKGLLDAMRPEEIDLHSGTHAPVPLPNPKGGKSFAGYSDRGDLAAVVGNSNIVNNVIADPVLYTRYNTRGGKWVQSDTLAVHYPICDTFMAQRTAMAQDMTCQYLHIAAAYTTPCHPLSMSRDTCNNPTWVPPSDALWALLEPHPPEPAPSAWAHQRRWAILETPWAKVAATVQTQVSTTPTLDQPIFLVKDNHLIPLEDFADAGPVSVAIRGPYLLLGRSEVHRQSQQHVFGQQGPERVYRLYDLRNAQVIDDFATSFNSVAFWPAGL